MNDGIPDLVDLARLAQAGAALAGRVTAARLQRLREVYAEVDDATVRVAFGLDPGDGRVQLRGDLTGRVLTTCQRCLGPLWLELASHFEIRPDEEEAPVPPPPAGSFDLLALIEDELLLACPMIPRHADTGCAAASDPALAARGGRPNPFDALATLRQNTAPESGDARADPQSQE